MLKIFGIFSRPERYLWTIIGKVASAILKRRLKSLELADDYERERLVSSIRSFHQLVVNIEGLVLSLVPIIFIVILSTITIIIFGSEEPWYSLDRFAVVWIIASIYLIYLDFKENLIGHLTFRAREFFDQIPAECRCDVDSILELWAPFYMKVRRFCEVFMLTLGTLMSGYAELFESWYIQYWKSLSFGPHIG